MFSKKACLSLVILILVMGVFYFTNPKAALLEKSLSCHLSAERFLKPGLTRTYHVNYSQSADSDWTLLMQQPVNKSAPQAPAQKPNLGQKTSLHFESQWQMTFIEQNGEIFIFNELKNPVVEMTNNGLENKSLLADMKRQLSQAFILKIDSFGKVLHVQTSMPLTNIEKNLIRWLISESEVVWSDQTQNSWLTREQDPNGVYEGLYQNKANDSHHFNILKTKTHYFKNASTHHGDKLNIQMKYEPQVKSEIQGDCDRAVIEKIVSSGTTQFKIGQTKVGAGKSNFQMNLISEVQDLNLSAKIQAVLKKRSSQAEFNLIATESHIALDRMVQETELNHLTASQLIKLLRDAKSSADPEAIQALYLKFKALVYLHPESCDLLAAEMKKLDLKASKSMQMLATALSAVGSPEAQNALISVLEARSNEVAAAQVLIPAIGMTEHPTAEAEEALKNLIHTSEQEDILTTAGLSLGAVAGHLAVEAPERQKAIVDGILKDIENVDSEGQKRFLISILGNAGSADSMPVLIRALESSRPAEQSEAAMAMRFIPGPEADEKLLQVLTSPSQASVKLAAATAIDYRDPNMQRCQSLRSIFASQSDVTVRREIVKDIFECRYVDAGVAEWLNKVKSNDPSEDVRKIAANFWSMIGTSVSEM